MTKFRAKWEQLNASSRSNEALKISRGHNQPPPSRIGLINWLECCYFIFQISHNDGETNNDFAYSLPACHQDFFSKTKG